MYKTDPVKHAAIASGMAGIIGERSDAVLGPAMPGHDDS